MRSNRVYSEGFSFLTCIVKVSMRTCITVTRYRIQYKTQSSDKLWREYKKVGNKANMELHQAKYTPLFFRMER